MTLPAPRYAIGETVWHAYTTTKTIVLPCPDCLGSGKWKAITPAGDELEMACQRCSEAWHSYGHEPLTYTEFTGTARALTIGSIRMDTAESRGPFSYMCRETGVGSGTVYYEEHLFASKAEAQAAAQAEARAQNEKTPWVAERSTSARQHSHFKFVIEAVAIAEAKLTRAVRRGEAVADELYLIADKNPALANTLRAIALKAENLRLDAQALDHVLATAATK